LNFANVLGTKMVIQLVHDVDIWGLEKDFIMAAVTNSASKLLQNVVTRW